MIIYGCGTLGTEIARACTGSVAGVTRTSDRHDRIRREVPHIELSTQILPPAGRTVICAPSSAQLDLIRSISPPTGRALLVSSTAVYTPYRGAIDASSALGESARAQTCQAIETEFRSWAGSQGIILRLGGLFHESRGPAAVYARTRKVRFAPGNIPLPLIHYQDAARLVIDLLQAADPAPVTLGVAHQPTREQFYRAQAALLSCDPPVFDAPVAAPHHFVGSAPTPSHPWIRGASS